MLRADASHTNSQRPAFDEPLRRFQPGRYATLHSAESIYAEPRHFDVADGFLLI